jgi:predicted DNA binding CopG/RHH family protein
MAKKTKFVHIRIEESELQRIKIAAARRDIPVAQYLRYMIDLGERADYAGWTGRSSGDW